MSLRRAYRQARRLFRASVLYLPLLLLLPGCAANAAFESIGF